MPDVISDIAAVAALALTPVLLSVIILVLASVSLNRRWFLLVSRSLMGLSLAFALLLLIAHVVDHFSGYPAGSLEYVLTSTFVVCSTVFVASSWLLGKLNFRLQYDRGG
jgi:hypothetical protein